MKNRQPFETTIDLLTPLTLTDRADHLAVLRNLCDCESLAPDFFDEVEPIREPFDRSKPDSVVDTLFHWHKGDSPGSYMWLRRKPKSWGSIYVQKYAVKFNKLDHAYVSLSADAGGDPAMNEQLLQFMRRTALALFVDFGLITEGRSITTTNDLIKGIPNLCWATVLGKPYVELFGGPERIAKTPVAVCEQLAPDLFYLQLTDDLNDVRDQPGAVEAARQSAKEYLGLDAFADPSRPDFKPRLPEFVFPGRSAK